MVVSTTEDFKRMSLKEMERKEKRKMKRRDGDITPRKGKSITKISHLGVKILFFLGDKFVICECLIKFLKLIIFLSLASLYLKDLM